MTPFTISTFHSPTLYHVMNPSHIQMTGRTNLKRGWGAIMRLSVAVAVGCLFLTTLSAAELATAAIRKQTNISPQSLGSALQALAKDRELQVLYRTEVVGDRHTSGAVGELTFDDALTRLLHGSNLTFQYLDDKTVTILPLAEATTSQPNAPWGRLRLAQTDPPKGTAAPQSGANTDEPGARNTQMLEEIIVTAQKRREQMIDVPQSVSVLSSEVLSRLGATQFRDFANTVPGLSFTTAGAGFTQISLRGVTTGRDVGPTVGVYVDEVPYGSSSTFANGSQLALDLGLFDVQQIEVLRGPQGTLYGASTMGGLIKYVCRRPDATRLGVEARTGVSDTHDGGVSYHGAATLNAPLVLDKVALRATGFYSRDGGYIDNLARNEKDVNRSDVYGGRLDLLLAPIEALDIRLSAFAQDIKRDGEGTSDYAPTGAPLDSDLDQRRLFAEPFDQEFRLVSGTLTYDFGPASLTSISSYQTSDTAQIADYSPLYVPLLSFFGIDYGAVGFGNRNTTDKFTQEVRLASVGTQTVEWLVGGFYTHEVSGNQQIFYPLSVALQPVPDNLFTFSLPSRFDEYAAFGDVTWRLSPTFDVTGGVRYAENRQSFEQIGSGLFGFSTPIRRSKDDVFTYLANARYHFGEHSIGYVRYATGYRPGGPNFVTIDVSTGLPVGSPTFQADRLKSYEVGYKAETADRRFGVDVSAYYIDWSDIQVVVVQGGFSGVGNATGGATIRGSELTVTANVIEGATITGTMAYQNAQLSAAEVTLGAAKGEQLPNVPELSATLNADYMLPFGNLQPTIGMTLRYVDDRRSGFGVAAYLLPEYTTVDLRTGLQFGSVSANIYVRNVLDERGQLSTSPFRGLPQPAMLQPRTIGIGVTTQF